MADQSAAAHHAPSGDATKRDMLQLIASFGAAIGVGAIAWPLIDSMNPSKDVLALSSVDVDLTPVVEGQGITIVWQGKPIFVRHRTATEIKEAQDTPLGQLIEPQTDAARVKSILANAIGAVIAAIPKKARPRIPAVGDTGKARSKAARKKR